MGILIKFLMLLAALSSFLVSVLDLLDRLGLDVSGLLAAFPNAVSAVPQAYSNWVDNVSDKPEVARMSADMVDIAPATGAGGDPMPLAISGAIAALMVIFLLFVAPRLFRR